jgi:hypothetical protein
MKGPQADVMKAHPIIGIAKWFFWIAYKPITGLGWLWKPWPRRCDDLMFLRHQNSAARHDS